MLLFVWPSQFPLSWQLHHIFNLLQNVKELHLVYEAIEKMDTKTSNKISHRVNRAKQALKKKAVKKVPKKKTQEGPIEGSSHQAGPG